jgi:hypothetical protein
MAQEIGAPARFREAVGVFRDPRELERAVLDLMTSGFDRADVSLLATQDTVRHKLPHHYQDTHAAEDDPEAPRAGWSGPEGRTVSRSALGTILGYVGAVTAGGIVVASGGAAEMAIAAGVIGAGAAGGVGYTLGRMFNDRVARNLQDQLEHGGIILWVKVDNDEEGSRASDVLRRHGAWDVHVHELPC